LDASGGSVFRNLNHPAMRSVKSRRRVNSPLGLNMKAGHLVLLFVFLLTGCGGQSQPPKEQTPSQTQDSPKPDARFRCEGKTRCSQMSSCEEATFYIQNCPGTEMDGDGDGVPCESQWCGH
jgi:excalibur calcium-binding domain-containing protein